MNNASQSSLSPFGVMSGKVAMPKKAQAPVRTRPPQAKSLTALVVDAHVSTRSEDRIWLLLAVCGWVVLGLSFWLRS